MSEKIEAFWQDATADDVARVMAGETVEARFRDSQGVKWVKDGCSLAGWRAGAWASGSGLPWTHCQVYREPFWWTDKPDPGPGYRLLGKFPDEPKLATDEAWICPLREWRPTFTNDGDQVKTVWYRRRIEDVEPEPKHYVLRVGDSVESPTGDRIKCVKPGVEQRHWRLRATDTIGIPNGQTITITEKGFEVTQ